MSVQYYQSQVGTRPLRLTLLAAVAVVAVIVVKGWHPALGVALVLLGLVPLLFWRMEVEVDEEAVRVIFGVGLLHRTIPLKAIANVAPLRIPWYSGWGMRRLRNGWFYSVSGRYVLEITLDSGECHRIGSDEPNRLGRAILRTRGNWETGLTARTLREI